MNLRSADTRQKERQTVTAEAAAVTASLGPAAAAVSPWLSVCLSVVLVYSIYFL